MSKVEGVSREEEGTHTGPCTPTTHLLHPRDDLGHHGDTTLLQLPGGQGAGAIARLQPRQLRIIIEEEAEVLEGDVHVWIPPVLGMELGRVPAPREGVAVDLVLDLRGCVGEVDGRVGVGRRHLAPRSLLCVVGMGG